MALATTTEPQIPRITPRMILGMPVEQFSYIMLGVGAAAPAIFIITVVIAMQCYKRQKKRKLMRLQLRYRMAQNSMDNGHMYPDQRRWTKDDVVLENPVLVSQKELSSTSNTAAHSIGGSVVIMNGSIRNNSLPDFEPKQSESEPNVFFTDISMPILQLNGKPVRLNDFNEVCSIRSTSSTRSGPETAPTSSAMHNWGFSPQESLLAGAPYQNTEENVKCNPIFDELAGCDTEQMFFDHSTLEDPSGGKRQHTISPDLDKPNEITTTAIVIENPHFSNTNDGVAPSTPGGKDIKSMEETSAELATVKADLEEGLSNVTGASQTKPPRYKKKSQTVQKPLPSKDKSGRMSNSETPVVPDAQNLSSHNFLTSASHNGSPVRDSEMQENICGENIKSCDESDNEHNQARPKSWLYTSYVNKAYEPEPVELENEEILVSQPMVS